MARSCGQAVAFCGGPGGWGLTPCACCVLCSAQLRVRAVLGAQGGFGWPSQAKQQKFAKRGDPGNLVRLVRLEPGLAREQPAVRQKVALEDKSLLLQGFLVGVAYIDKMEFPRPVLGPRWAPLPHLERQWKTRLTSFTRKFEFTKRRYLSPRVLVRGLRPANRS